MNLRERAAVDEWLNSDFGFHIMRDHPQHYIEILAGMWGVREGVLRDIAQWIEEYSPYGKGYDQIFLQSQIWPKIKSNHMAHDSHYAHIFGGQEFKVELAEGDFVGQPIQPDESTKLNCSTKFEYQ